MPTGNKCSVFRCKRAKNLAEMWNVPSRIWNFGISLSKRITYEDVEWLIDNINYDKYGIAYYNKKNVPLEKRYDVDNICYTENEFKIFYDIKNYYRYWHLAPRYIPSSII
jgi:hypothetical protein